MPDEPLSDANEAPAAESSTAAPDATAAAPSAADANKTLADVVKEAAAKSVESSTTTEGEGSTETAVETAPGGEVAPKKDGEEEPAIAVADEKDKELPFHKHARFQEIIKERATFKAKADELSPYAERAKAIDTYCQKHGITGEEFNSALEITALLRVNPAEGLKSLRTYVDTLEVSMGNKLPADLQKDVDDGSLSLERAKELTQARIKSQGLEHTSRRTEAQVVQERQASIASAVNSWDSQKRTTDTAYDKKYPFIEKTFIALCTMNPPRTPQEAVSLAEKAYAEVNTNLGSFVPKPPVKKVLRPNGAVTKAVIEIKPGMSLKEALPLIARKVIAEQSR